MKFRVKFTPNAQAHLRSFKKFEQQKIVDAIKQQLLNEPLTKTQNRKPLRNNPLSRWELRVEKYRVFYDVEIDVVEIKAIGHKEHNKLFIAGKEFTL